MFKKYRFIIPIVNILLLSLLSSCGGGGESNSTPSIQESIVVPLYSTNGANWNDYVRDDGADMFSASDSACDPATDTSCIHGGQMLSMEVPDQSSCVGLSAVDKLSVFEWTCEASTNPVRIISTGFKLNKGLSDLIDFNSGAFLANYLEVWKSGNIVTNSTPATWWDNNILINNDGSDGTDMLSGEVHIVTQNANKTYNIGANRVALVIKPGVTLTGSISQNETLVSVNAQNFVWLEGKFDATDDYYAVYFTSTKFSILNNVEVANAVIYGVILSSSSNNILNDIIATGNNNEGILLSSSSNNTLRNITATGNFNSGVHLFSYSNNNTLNNITASGNDTGIQLYSYSDNNSLNNINTSGNGSGIRFIVSSNYNNLKNVISCGNNFHGVVFNSSTNNSLSNIVTCDNNFHGVFLYSSSDNNRLSNITSTANIYDGVRINASTNNDLYNVTASGNTNYGVLLNSLSNSNSLNNITVTGNNIGIYLYSSSNNSLSGVLQVGDNSVADCYVFGGTDPGLTDGTCANQGRSDATLTTNVSITSSFVNPVIGDYSLLATDTAIRDILSLPTGMDTYIHTWSDGSATTMLHNAVELMDDGIGNDDMICESNESCLYTPNIAAYQGHGDLVTTGTFSDGTIAGVTLFQYETNGY